MSYLTTEETKQIQYGISAFTRMIGLFADPIRGPYIAEEQDLIAALESVKDATELSRRMLGKQKYQGIEFNVTAAILQDMRSFLMSGADEDESIALRRRNRPMYYLVIEPVVNVLAKYPHEEVLDLAGFIVDEVIDMSRQCMDYVPHAEALLAQEEVRKYVTARESEHRLAIEAKKRRPRKSAKSALIAMLSGVDLSEDSDE